PFDSIAVRVRSSPAAYDAVIEMKKISTAQRIGWGPIKLRWDVSRTRAHQKNRTRPTTRPGRPRSVIPGTIRFNAINVINATMGPIAKVAAGHGPRRRVT